MFFEYALEPGVVSSWDRARFFLDAFGPSKGRFLAEYPRHWKKMVYEELSCGDVEKKRITERLRGFDKRAFLRRVDAPYDRSRPWIENAHCEHQREPFRAIVAVSRAGQPHVLDAADVDDRNELWRVQTGQLVPRDPMAFVRALDLLLRKSRQVILIDPYFRADQNEKTRALAAFCDVVGAGTSLAVHCSDKGASYDYSMREAQRVLPKIIPFGVSVAIYCWKERHGGRRLHNRYLLTDLGGVNFGDSIEHGGTGHEDHLSILDDTSRTALWKDYVGAEPAFDLAGPPCTFVGHKRSR
jgi:hypothetical protein